MSAPNGYGAIPHSDSSARDGDHEQQALLGENGAASGSLRKRLMVDVARDWADVVLLLCYITTGLLDSSSISAWGSFVSMQTGSIPITRFLLPRTETDKSVQEIPYISV